MNAIQVPSEDASHRDGPPSAIASPFLQTAVADRLRGMAAPKRVRLSTIIRLASWGLAIAGIVVILTLGNDAEDRRVAAAWMGRGSTLILAAVALSIANVFIHRRGL